MWLAHDHEYVVYFTLKNLLLSNQEASEKRKVALKVTGPKYSHEAGDERRILYRLKERGNPKHPGRQYVVQPIDWFLLPGKSGTEPYFCLVLEALGPNLITVANSIKPEGGRLYASLARSVSQQLLLAVDYLHSAGVVHAGEFSAVSYIRSLRVLLLTQLLDLQRRHVLFQWCDLEDASIESLKKVPEYLKHPVEGNLNVTTHACDIKVIDFQDGRLPSFPSRFTKSMFFVSFPRRKVTRNHRAVRIYPRAGGCITSSHNGCIGHLVAWHNGKPTARIPLL